MKNVYDWTDFALYACWRDPLPSRYSGVTATNQVMPHYYAASEVDNDCYTSDSRPDEPSERSYQGQQTWGQDQPASTLQADLGKLETVKLKLFSNISKQIHLKVKYI